MYLLANLTVVTHSHCLWQNFKGFERLALIIQKGWNLEYESMDDPKVEVFAA